MSGEPARFVFRLEEIANPFACNFGFGRQLWRFELKCFHPAGAVYLIVAVADLLADRGDMLVVAGLGSAAYDVFSAGDHDGNFYLWGAMGGAALTGLGLAIAQPSRPVVVFTGDGEQLMGLDRKACRREDSPPHRL